MEKRFHNPEKQAKYIAEKKAARERRPVCVHKRKGSDVYYVTPEEKLRSREGRQLVETYEPESVEEQSNFEKKKVRNYSTLESGTKVVVNGENVETVSTVSSRQIVTNVGNKFRKSDGVEWGGGSERITHKLIKE